MVKYVLQCVYLVVSVSACISRRRLIGDSQCAMNEEGGSVGVLLIELSLIHI